MANPKRWADFEHAASHAEWPSVLALCGDEPFLRDRAIQLLRRSLFPDGEPPAAVHWADAAGSGADLPGLFGMACTPSMFSPRQLIIVREADRIPAKQTPLLERYLAAPANATTLVLDFAPPVSPWSREGKACKSFGLALQSATVYCLDRFREERHLLDFLTRLAVAEGVSVERSALHRLASRFGFQLTPIAQELAKLSILADQGEAVTAEGIDRLAQAHPQASVFELVDAVAARQLDLALSRLESVQDAGESPILILTLLARLFHQALVIRTRTDQRCPRPSILSELALTPFQARGPEEAARRYTRADLRSALARLGQAEEQAKGQRIPERSHMIMLLLRLCGPTRPAAHGPRGA